MNTKTRKISNFMHLPHVYPYKYALIFFPYERTTKFMKGTSKAWKEIIKQSHNIEPYDLTLDVNAVEKGISTFLVKDIKQLKKVINETTGTFNIFIGGEHTISYWTSSFFDFDTFFVFDAHADCMNIYNGKTLSHATWLRRTVERNKEKKFYIYGLRIASKEEKAFIYKNGIKVNNTFGALKKIKNKNVYLSIDLDVLDISSMPCCSNPEVNGLSWQQFINNIAHVMKNNNVVAVDIVEHKPIKGLEIYSYAVGWLIYKILCLKEKYG